MNTDRCFYSQLKNEDAMPFVGNNVLIVADGLGGSGSTVHNISPIEGVTLHDEIFNSAFADFDITKACDMLDYIELLISPMADGLPDTSALWASRIAIARCAYALCYDEDFKNSDLSDRAVRERLSQFISIGLERMAINFRLETNEYEGQKILPTTLAFIRYATDEYGETTAEVVWAGDSRCYLLTASGLKQLSDDDEDSSGAITNLFYYGGKRATLLNYRRYTLKAPCVLIAASDGIFDYFTPYNNFSVEKILLEHIEMNDSYGALMKSLSEFYDKLRGDDATMAFVPVGFEDYSSLKKALKDRSCHIIGMWQKYCDMEEALAVADNSEEEARSYMVSRTRDKFAAIMTMLLKNYKEHADDPIYTDEIKVILSDVRYEIAELQKREADNRRVYALNGMRAYLKDHIPQKNDNPFVLDLPKDIPANIDALMRKVVADADDMQCCMNRQGKRQRILEEQKKWYEIIRERQSYYWNGLNEQRVGDIEIKKFKDYGRALRIWIYIEIQFVQHFGLLQEINKLCNADRRIAKNIDSFIEENKGDLMASEREIDKSIDLGKKKYYESIDKLFDILSKTPSLSYKIFQENILKKFALLQENSNDGEISSDDSYLSGAWLSADDKKIEAVVDALAEHYDKNSMLDCYYNSTRLQAFRTYYKLKAQPIADIKEFGNLLESIEADYCSLIR